MTKNVDNLAELFLVGLQKQEDLIIEVDQNLWYRLIEYMADFDKENVRFAFKDKTMVNDILIMIGYFCHIK